MREKPFYVCHFSTVHSIHDTRVFERECVWLANEFKVKLIGIGNFKGNKKGVEIISFPKTKKPWQRFFSTHWKVMAEVLKTPADIFHFHDAELIPFAILLTILGKPVIYDIHENTKTDILLKTWLPNIVKSSAAKLYDVLLNISSQFLYFIPVVWNKNDVNKLHAKPGKYCIIQNFADINLLKAYQIEDRFKLPGNNIFYIGMIKDIYYNIYPLFDAMLHLKKQGLITHLHLVGYFGLNQKQDFSDYKHWDELKPQITYYGKLNLNDAYEISKKCKLGICLKNQPEEMVLSHERKLFEYLAIGLPAIFCDSEIYKDLNKINIGISTSLKDSHAISGAIQEILANEKQYKQMVNNAVEKFSSKNNWENEYDQLRNFYLKILLKSK